MRYSDDERAIIWLDGFVGLTKEQKLQAIKSAGRPSRLLEDISLIKQYIGRELAESTFNTLQASLRLGMPDSFVDDLEKIGAVAITCMSDGFPDQFLDIPSPPMIIYCKGNIDLLQSVNLFTMVGSRKTIPAIMSRAEEIAAELAKNGVTIVTGLAEGGDTAAIRGALPTGKIISILPCGFKHIYPSSHLKLYEDIVDNGLVITEYSPNVTVDKFRFPERNRLLAALSKGVLVTSAGEKSGTYYTADFANEYGKSVFAFPYTPGTPSGVGCNAMIKEFAMLCDSSDDILLSLGITKRKEQVQPPLSDAEQKVFNCIKEEEIHIDLLLQKTGMKIFELSPVLTMLEIKKYIVKNPSNTYSAIR